MTVRTIYSDPHDDLRAALRALCAEFSDDYHRNNGRNRTYPVKSIDALTKGGWLSAMIPEKFGGSGLGLTKASIVMEGTNRCGCNAGHCHGQMYNVGTLLRYGVRRTKISLPSFHCLWRAASAINGVTEPTTGTDTTKINTVAKRVGARYIISGQKVWISRIEHSDLMILLGAQHHWKTSKESPWGYRSLSRSQRSHR